MRESLDFSVRINNNDCTQLGVAYNVTYIYNDFDVRVHKDMGFRVGGVAGGGASRRGGSGKEKGQSPFSLERGGDFPPYMILTLILLFLLGKILLYYGHHKKDYTRNKSRH